MQNGQTKILALLAIGAWIVLYLLSLLGYLGDNPLDKVNSFNIPLLVPHYYAFAIWTVIYTGLITFPLYQFILRSKEDSGWNTVRIYYSANIVLNGLWLVSASYEWLVVSLVLMILMLITLFKINLNLIELKKLNDIQNYWIEHFVFSIYFSWATLATILNVSAALAFYQWDGLGLSEEYWTFIIIPLAAMITGYTSWRYRDAAYAGVVVWTFIALAIKHAGKINSITGLSLVVTAIFLVIIYIIKKTDKATQFLVI